MTAVVGDAPAEALYPKLKPGPGRPPEEVRANQCARLCGAMVEVVAKGGYERVTVRGLARLAGVSTKTFYKCFANVEDCFTATFSRIVRDTLRHASEVPSDGEDPIHARIRAIFEALARDSKAAQLVLVDFYSAGPGAYRTARAAGRTFERLIGDEFAARPHHAHIPPALVEGLFGAALRVARARLLNREGAEPVAVAKGFADWLLLVGDDRLSELQLKATGGGQNGDRLPRPRPTIGDERQFLLAAVAKLSVSEGYENLTVASIRREAGVPRRAFDANFADVTECFLAAVESRLEGARQRAEREARSAGDWERGMVRMVSRVCAEVARDPELARLGFMDIFAPGRAGLELRERLVTRWTERLLASVPSDRRYDELAAEASMAAVWNMIKSEAVAGRSVRVSALAPVMAFVLLAPALGRKAAEAAVLAEFGPAAASVRSQKTSVTASLTV